MTLSESPDATRSTRSPFAAFHVRTVTINLLRAFQKQTRQRSLPAAYWAGRDRRSEQHRVDHARLEVSSEARVDAWILSGQDLQRCQNGIGWFEDRQHWHLAGRAQ